MGSVTIISIIIEIIIKLPQILAAFADVWAWVRLNIGRKERKVYYSKMVEVMKPAVKKQQSIKDTNAKLASLKQSFRSDFLAQGGIERIDNEFIA